MDDFIDAALSRSNALLGMLIPGEGEDLPTPEEQREAFRALEMQTFVDSVRLKDEYLKHASQREREADALFGVAPD